MLYICMLYRDDRIASLVSHCEVFIILLLFDGLFRLLFRWRISYDWPFCGCSPARPLRQRCLHGRQRPWASNRDSPVKPKSPSKVSAVQATDVQKPEGNWRVPRKRDESKFYQHNVSRTEGR